MGASADGPKINLTVYTPANAKGPVPIILLVNFGGGPPRAGGPGAAAGAAAPAGQAAPAAGAKAGPPAAGRGGRWAR